MSDERDDARTQRILEVGRCAVRVERRGEVADDVVIREEPLEIRLDGEPLAVTMRTPGEDVELAVGFLHAEGILTAVDELERVDSVEDDRVEVSLRPAARERFAEREREARMFPATSACGVCGKPSLEDLWQRIPRLVAPTIADRDLDALVARLPERMRESQPLFGETGGVHAAALFDEAGRLLDLREDVGRHNAIDKLVGAALLDGRLPFECCIVVTSGRAGYEIVQKALAAGAPVLAAVGAASSLAVRLASLGGMRLYSFVGRDGGNRHLSSAEPEPRLRRGADAE
jgi:FdhD protein